MKTQDRSFRMHPRMLYDVMRRQAGSLTKAMMEAVMNSVDAKASECRLTVTESRLAVTDDGKGFASRTEVDNWFEEFGHPPEEGEAKTYGYFRMGRGQLFAFGVNTWRTGQFKMSRIDIKSHGLDYTLEEGLSPAKGCVIEVQLYEKLNRIELTDITREFSKAVKYVPIPVYLNGVQVSKDITKIKWDFETAEGYVKLDERGGVDVYNLGIFVCEYPGYKFGTGGTVVSKKQLTLNFARNDVMMNECKIWRDLKKFLRAKATEKNVRKKALGEDGRQNILDQLICKEITPADAADVKIVTDVRGRHWSLAQLRSAIPNQYNNTVTSAPKGSRVGDMLHGTQSAFVIADCTIDLIGDNLAGVAKTLQKWVTAVNGYGECNWTVKTLAALSKGVNTNHILIPEKDWTADNRLAIKLIEAGHMYISAGLGESQAGGWRKRWGETRKILLGDSETANAWTDGDTYIAFGRDFLGKHNLWTYRGLCKVFLTCLHEYCHVDPDTNEHDHDLDFFQKFHDNRDLAADAADHAFRYIETITETVGRKATKQMLSLKDKVDALAEKQAAFVAKSGELNAVAAQVKILKGVGKTPRQGKAPRVAGKPPSKRTVYDTWKAGTTDPEKLLKVVSGAVQIGTIRGWISAWAKGNNLPGGVKG